MNNKKLVKTVITLALASMLIVGCSKKAEVTPTTKPAVTTTAKTTQKTTVSTTKKEAKATTKKVEKKAEAKVEEDRAETVNEEVVQNDYSNYSASEAKKNSSSKAKANNVASENKTYTAQVAPKTEERDPDGWYSDQTYEEWEAEQAEKEKAFWKNTRQDPRVFRTLEEADAYAQAHMEEEGAYGYGCSGGGDANGIGEWYIDWYVDDAN